MCSITRCSADRQRCYSSEYLFIMIIAEIFSFNEDGLEQLSSPIYRRLTAATVHYWIYRETSSTDIAPDHLCLACVHDIFERSNDSTIHQWHQL